MQQQETTFQLKNLTSRLILVGVLPAVAAATTTEFCSHMQQQETSL